MSSAPAMLRDARVARLLLALAMALALEVTAASPEIEVEALFTDTAVLRIDGERKMLKVGQSHAGVTLVAAYSRTATLSVDGQEMIVGISRRIGSNYQEPAARQVKIQRDSRLQYVTRANINGRGVKVLVDTGANVVALNSIQARNLGVDFETGARASVETAGGIVNGWRVVLRSIDVGGIKVKNVDAMVLEGEFPATVLLGMTYLRHVEITETDGVLSLSRDW